MTTRPITGADAAEAAELVRTVRARPNDFVDPFPPASEIEILADSGARGKEPEVHPRVSVEPEGIAAFGAIDFSPELRCARLVGPVVHPAHRRKGHGRRLLDDLIGQARAARQKYARATIGALNASARALLEAAGFKRKETHTLLRLARPEHRGLLAVEGVTVARAEPEHDGEVHALVGKLIPRTARQTRSLLKSEDYAILLARKKGEAIGIVELDLRAVESGTVEFLDGPPSLIHAGLGTALLSHAVRAAFEREPVRHLDLVMNGTDRERIESYGTIGFHVAQEITRYEAKL